MLDTEIHTGEFAVQRLPSLAVPPLLAPAPLATLPPPVPCVGNTFCWDDQLFRTLGPLLRRPGFLTRHFMLGRRMRDVQSRRLFLFTSAVCLTLRQFGHTQFVKLEVDPNAAPGK